MLAMDTTQKPYQSLPDALPVGTMSLYVLQYIVTDLCYLRNDHTCLMLSLDNKFNTTVAAQRHSHFVVNYCY